MAGTRLLIAVSFAIPFVLVLTFSIYLGIPHDDLLWKRLASLVSNDAAVRWKLDPTDPGDAKPLLYVAKSWTPNAVEKILYEIIHVEDRELKVLCEDMNQQPITTTDAIVLCEQKVNNSAVSVRGKLIRLYSKSTSEFRRMVLSNQMRRISPRVLLLYEQQPASNWRELTDAVLSWTTLWNDPCMDDISVQLRAVDAILLTGGSFVEEWMRKFFAVDPIATTTKDVIVYFTSSDRVQAIDDQQKTTEFQLGRGYLYFVPETADISSILSTLQGGFHRIRLQDCWNVPVSTKFEDANGLQTLYRIYNATVARREKNALSIKAALLQHRVDHIDATGHAVDAEYVQRSLRLLTVGKLREAKQTLNQVRFHMSPDFPWDQYAAIFAPLLFPLLVPAIMTTMKELKRYRTRGPKK